MNFFLIWLFIHVHIWWKPLTSKPRWIRRSPLWNQDSESHLIRNDMKTLANGLDLVRLPEWILRDPYPQATVEDLIQWGKKQQPVASLPSKWSASLWFFGFMISAFFSLLFGAARQQPKPQYNTTKLVAIPTEMNHVFIGDLVITIEYTNWGTMITWERRYPEWQIWSQQARVNRKELTSASALGSHSFSSVDSKFAELAWTAAIDSSIGASSKVRLALFWIHAFGPCPSKLWSWFEPTENREFECSTRAPFEASPVPISAAIMLFREVFMAAEFVRERFGGARGRYVLAADKRRVRALCILRSEGYNCEKNGKSRKDWRVG